ncbi:MAG: hypothetical protein AAFS10_10150, partial [Myxococcota bacterium]
TTWMGMLRLLALEMTLSSEAIFDAVSSPSVMTTMALVMGAVWKFASLDSVISKANSLSIPIHVVGLGEASELDSTFSTDGSNTTLIQNLRDLASKTGGFYASASSADELVELADTIAIGLTGGFEAASVRLDPVPPSGTVVRGRIRAKYSDGSFGPYTDWNFVAP